MAGLRAIHFWLKLRGFFEAAGRWNGFSADPVRDDVWDMSAIP